MIHTLSTTVLIDSMSPQFTKTDWKIVQFLKSNPIEFINLSALDLATRIGTSDASIIRFVQKIGYNGLNEFKNQYKNEIEASFSKPTSLGTQQLHDDYLTSLSQLFKLTQSETLDMFNHLIENANSIYVCSFDSYTHIAAQFVNKFMMLGIKITPITNITKFQFYRLHAKKDDLFIIFTFDTVFDQLENDFRLLDCSGARIILIHDTLQNKLNEHVDLDIFIPKTIDLVSHFCISTSVLLLIQIDIFFSSVFYSNTIKYSQDIQNFILLTEDNKNIITQSIANLASLSLKPNSQ